MPEGTPGRLLERLGPLAVLVGIPGLLFCPPPRVGDPERTGPPTRLGACRFCDPGRLGPVPTRLLETGRFDNP